MKITVIGTTGMVGSRIVAEAGDRGHGIIAASRHPEHTPRPEVHPLAIDASRSQDLDRALRGADAAVLTVRATPGQTQQFLSITEEVLQATAHARVPLLIVGGAGPLRSPNRADILVVDDPEFVAAEWKELAAASVAQLDVCRNQGGDHWTYLSPPAVLEPGNRLGEYQRGTTALLIGADGQARISAEDLAAAVIDELESPEGDRHFTVARV
ncbi:3-beta hydroxysteroid dehydrogenase [Brevibacterium sediminis]|uniref:3-beta hydroxysteroid dehydrogenase n=1 Tax=Brevibacterium sediminis TaxID=1857024 RepID=A0ABQ1M0P5_9MICO|nr:NAD(P)H-binding protein [Brevibacterium sediminis]GGC30854.1 3-beta hydroxysteroid dehydrogenase [Brevibacterium sediminis]